MIPVLTKPIAEIGPNDIQALIDGEVREGQEIEFKEDLSTERPGSDPWREGQGLPNRAKDTILKQVTGFANAYGGVLILGIAESKSKPSVAGGVSPIPRCVDLAQSLKLVVRDGVEPQIPAVEITAVRIDDDSGVVLLRVGTSRMAPHRVKRTRVCAVRRDDRTEDMTMREIQDMTLNVARGMERLEQRFNDRAERFVREFARLDKPDHAWGVRVTAVPVGEDLRVQRLYGKVGIDGRFLEPWPSVFRGKTGTRVPHSHLGAPDQWRPVLRGARATYHSAGTRPEFDYYREIRCDGLVETGFCYGRVRANEDTLPLSEGLPVLLLANTLTQAHRLRTEAGAPTAEYAIEVRIDVAGSIPVVVAKDGDPIFSRERQLDPEHGRFPRYALGSPDEIPALLTTFHQDLWDSLGLAVEAEQFSIQGWPVGADGP